MNDEVLIKVEGVSKKFCRSLKKSMLYGIEDIIRDTLSLKTKSEKLREQEFWAVDDVSFEVRRGECLGIIGRNGAGKSTLLKMLNGIFLPDKGKITITGKVCSLIEVGAGFHPMLSGRENIYVNGAILGMSRQEIENKFDDIVSFAELEEFIDMPVKHYSSGMYVRLGFAIAMQVEPDVLILDEVLAVGDAAFRAKSFNQISNIIKNSAVIFVSHSMPYIGRICSKTLLMNKGLNCYYGDKVGSGISEYLKLAVSEIKPNYFSHDDTYINDICLNGSKGNNIYVAQEESILLSFKVYISGEHDNPEMMLVIANEEYFNVVQLNSPLGAFKCKNNVRSVEVAINGLFLNSGYYSMTLAVLDRPNGMILARYNNCCQFSVTGNKIGFASILHEGSWRVI